MSFATRADTPASRPADGASTRGRNAGEGAGKFSKKATLRLGRASVRAVSDTVVSTPRQQGLSEAVAREVADRNFESTLKDAAKIAEILNKVPYVKRYVVDVYTKHEHDRLVNVSLHIAGKGRLPHGILEVEVSFKKGFDVCYGRCVVRFITHRAILAVLDKMMSKGVVVSTTPDVSAPSHLSSIVAYRSWREPELKLESVLKQIADLPSVCERVVDFRKSFSLKLNDVGKLGDEALARVHSIVSSRSRAEVLANVLLSENDRDGAVFPVLVAYLLGKIDVYTAAALCDEGRRLLIAHRLLKRGEVSVSGGLVEVNGKQLGKVGASKSLTFAYLAEVLRRRMQDVRLSW